MPVHYFVRFDAMSGALPHLPAPELRLDPGQRFLDGLGVGKSRIPFRKLAKLLLVSLVLHIGVLGLLNFLEGLPAPKIDLAQEIPVELVTQPPPELKDTPKKPDRTEKAKKPKEPKKAKEAQKPKPQDKPQEQAQAQSALPESKSPPPQKGEAKPDQKAAEAAKPAEPARSEPAKSEPPKAESPKQEAKAAEPPKPPATQPEPAKEDKADPPKPEAAKPDLKLEPPKPEPVKPESAKPEPAKEQAKAEPSQAEPAKTEAAKAEGAKAEPAKQEPPKPAEEPQSAAAPAQQLAAAQPQQLTPSQQQLFDQAINGQPNSAFGLRPSKEEAEAALPVPPDDDPIKQAVAVPAPSDDGDLAVAYKTLVFSKLELAKNYPEEARKRGAHGSSVIAFALDEKGHVRKVTLIQSSGDTALDVESLALVERAAPFPSPPPGAQKEFAAVVEFGVDPDAK